MTFAVPPPGLQVARTPFENETRRIIHPFLRAFWGEKARDKAARWPTAVMTVGVHQETFLMAPRSAKLPNRKTLLLNGGVLLVVSASVIWALKSSFIKTDIAACSERYPRAVRIGLDRNGQAMQSSDLQAMMGGSDWNLLANTRVVGLKAGPAPFAMEFKTVVAHQSTNEDDRKPGIGFVWTPQAVLNATGACLAYSVFVPEDFDFGAGGRLPGLVSSRKVEDPKKPEPVSTRITWNETGRLDLSVHTFEHAGGRAIGSVGHAANLVRGRWTSIEQEVVIMSQEQHAAVK